MPPEYPSRHSRRTTKSPHPPRQSQKSNDGVKKLKKQRNSLPIEDEQVAHPEPEDRNNSYK